MKLAVVLVLAWVALVALLPQPLAGLVVAACLGYLVYRAAPSVRRDLDAGRAYLRTVSLPVRSRRVRGDHL